MVPQRSNWLLVSILGGGWGSHSFLKIPPYIFRGWGKFYIGKRRKKKNKCYKFSLSIKKIFLVFRILEYAQSSLMRKNLMNELKGCIKITI
jgi:hypothetical protein